MNWKNVDLLSAYERDQPILDELSFEVLLLEIQCNLKEINERTVTEQFETDLQNRIESAREVFALNLSNLVKQANKERSY